MSATKLIRPVKIALGPGGKLRYKGQLGELDAKVGTVAELAHVSTVRIALRGVSSGTPVAVLSWIESNRKGGGTRMMASLMQLLDALGVRYTVLDPAADDEDDQGRLLAFYERFGFKSTSRCDGSSPMVRKSFAALRKRVVRP